MCRQYLRCWYMYSVQLRWYLYNYTGNVQVQYILDRVWKFTSGKIKTGSVKLRI